MKNKPKKFAGGGLSGIAAEATSLISAADNAANAINSIKNGSVGQGSVGGSGALGFLNNSNPAQGLKSEINPDMYNQLLTQQKNFSSQLAGLANTGRLTFKKGGKVSSASKRADGIAIRGKTRA